jgi:uncharacterized Zn ribbon protein
MADGVDEVGTVQRVEVERLHAFVDEVHDLLGRDSNGNQMARGDVVIKALEAKKRRAA